MAAKITWTNPFPADVGVVLFVRARTPSTRGECSITLNGAIDALRVTFAGNPIQATWTTGDSLSVRLNPFGVRDPKLLVMTGDGLTLIDYDLDRGHGLAPRVVERRLVGAAFPGRLYLSPETIADEGVATFYRTGPLDSDGDGLDNVLEAELGLDPAGRDRDDDGLDDGWEFDGVNDIALHSRGANPLVRDVFVEVDYGSGSQPGGPTHDHRVTEAAKRKVEGFYRDLNICNPNPCVGGVNVRVENDDRVCADDCEVCLQPPSFSGGCVPQSPRFLGLHQASKVGIYHWGLSLHRVDKTRDCAGGIADGVPTDRFLFTQLWTSGSSQIATEDEFDLGVILAHELGHALGLHHGGDDDLACKPMCNHFRP